MKTIFQNSIFRTNPFSQGVCDGLSRDDDGMYEDTGNDTGNDVFDWGFAVGQYLRTLGKTLRLIK